MAKDDVDIAAVRHLARALNANPFYKTLVVAAEFMRAEIFGGPGTTTLYALIKRFNGPTAPLEDVAREFFGLSREKAYEYASCNKLPVPAFRCTESNKSPLLVHVEDLATLVDARRAAAWVERDRACEELASSLLGVICLLSTRSGHKAWPHLSLHSSQRTTPRPSFRSLRIGSLGT
jgi:hypothetical protein